MLSIPSTVKALFKRDGVRKNIRIHFPNGEYPDITNDNIVKESATFAESVCSQESVKYGLTEASVFQVETVGIGNMYGMTIEVGVEIDTTTLTAAEIAAIEGDEGDGTLVKAADSDIGFGYYRVPYGVFRVQSCPRNQEAMTHRKVTAYTRTITAVQGLPYMEEKKLAAKGSVSTMTVNIRRQAMTLLANGNDSILAANGFTKTLFGDSSSFRTGSASGTIPPMVSGISGTITYSASLLYGRLGTTIIDSGAAQDAIFGLHNGSFASVFPQLVEWCESKGIQKDNLEAWARSAFIGCYPNLRYESLVSVGVQTPRIPITKDETVYPFRDGMSATYYVPASISVTYGGVTETFTPTGSDPAEIYIWSDDTPWTETMTFASTGSGNSGQADWYTFIGVLEEDRIINGYLELLGVFGRTSRSGGFVIESLDASNPEAIGPSDTQELWWDEYDVQPVGTILYAYGDNQEGSYEFGGGTSIYDLRENFIVQHMDNATETSVETLLDATLVPALAAINFTPIELDIRAMPWIEAGDPIQITTEDGVVVESYALAHTISGIQHLVDAIESHGGDLMEG